MPDAVLAHDIAYDQGDIWVACENSSHSIRCYDTSGSLVDFIETSLVPAAAGLCMDPDGYLWAGDNANSLIYKIDPDGTVLAPDTWAGVKRDCSTQ